jgi:O-antigen ligase
LGVVNTIYTLLQVFYLLPVAQINERELIGGVVLRPTGIFFNAFAMSYASLFFIAISLYLIYSKNIEVKQGIFFIIFPFISLVLSSTRTSLFLGLIFISVMILFKFFTLNNISKKYIFWTILSIGAFSPYILMIIGMIIGNTEWATINGRTQMWNCVFDKRSELLPFGVGLENAFPPKYCTESGWFSNLRHPENMFFLAYVESGILGILTYILLFIYTLKYTYQKFIKNNFLPYFVTIIFLLASLIYVPFFHYLPFLPDRPADRGIFNFHLIYFFWLFFLANDLSLKTSNINTVRKYS